MTVEILAQIEVNGEKPFRAGIVLWDDVVIEAAPIVGYMKRQKWTRERVRRECRKNGWTVKVIHQIDRTDV